MHLTRGPLYNQVAAETGAAPAAPAPAAAPQAAPEAAPAPVATTATPAAEATTTAPAPTPTAPPDSGAMSWESAMSAFDSILAGGDAPPQTDAPAAAAPVTTATPGQPETPALDTTTPQTPAEAPKFKPYKPIEDQHRPTSVKERFLLSESNRNAAASAQQIEQYYQQQLAQTQQQLNEQRAFRERFESLRSAGKHDEAIQLLGVKSFADLQQEVLRAKGALPPRDPAVEAMKEELAQFKRERAEAQAASQRMAQQAQAERERLEVIQLAQAELKKATDYEHLPQLAEIPGAAEMLVDSYRANPQADVDAHFSLLHHRFRGFYDSLHAIFGGAQPAPLAANPASPPAQAVSPVSPPAQPGAAAVKPTTVLPQLAAADGVATRTYANRDEQWEALLGEALRQ